MGTGTIPAYELRRRVLRTCYEISSIDLGSAATRQGWEAVYWYCRCELLSTYVPPMRCPRA
eukprot:1678959-Rhodomonas_salina.2